jgi:hypothetical protein
VVGRKSPSEHGNVRKRGLGGRMPAPAAQETANRRSH